MSTLTHADFSAFFQDIHGHAPFPWQRRLASQVAEQGAWPDQLALPTGSGKTAAIDIAVFHLALEADRGPRRRAPMRIALVVDRRLVVDDAFTRACTIARHLREATGGVAARVAERLKHLSGKESPPLIARRLRGGIPREEDWTRSPAQPTILCSTVDQIGSRLLFRGYGVSDGMKPVHAGLIGADCLILLDEAHLADPFRQTLERVKRYRTVPRPDDGPGDAPSPWMVATLTATPRARCPATCCRWRSTAATSRDRPGFLPVTPALRTTASPTSPLPASGDPLGADPLGADPDRVLAKSRRALPRDARERANLPEKWRHEALSVRLALHMPERLDRAADPDLVLWLVGTHHGHGRPLFPHADPADKGKRTDLPAILGIPAELPAGPGPQSLGFDRGGLDWPGLFERLKGRYGVWELARLEAILRLADHHASAKAAKRTADRDRTVNEGEAA